MADWSAWIIMEASKQEAGFYKIQFNVNAGGRVDTMLKSTYDTLTLGFIEPKKASTTQSKLKLSH